MNLSILEVDALPDEDFIRYAGLAYVMEEREQKLIIGAVQRAFDSNRP